MKVKILLFFLISEIISQKKYLIENETKLKTENFAFMNDTFDKIELFVGSGKDKNIKQTKLKGIVDMQISQTYLGILEANSSFGINCSTSKSKLVNTCFLFQSEGQFTYKNILYEGIDAELYLRVNEEPFDAACKYITNICF